MAVYSIAFDGIAGYVSTPCTPLFKTITDAFSFVAWYKSTSNSEIMIFTESSTTNSSAYILLELGGISAGKLDVYFGNSGNSIVDAATSNDGKWHSAALTYDGTTFTLYRDGVSVGTKVAVSADFTGTKNTVTIGALTRSSTAFFWSGNITQVARYASALTADQIGQIAAGVDPATIGTPATVYEFSEGSGSSLADTSGNGNNGTLQSGATWDSSIPAQLTSGVQYSQFAGNSGYETTASFSGAALWYGNNRMLSIDVALLSVNDTVTAMTYGGANCTLVQAQNVAGGTGRVECWRICQNDSGAPAIGSNTLSVTISGTLANAVLWVGRINVNQSSPTEAPNGASGIATGTTASATITTITANDVVHAALATNTASGVACGQTQRNNVNGALGTGADEDTPVATPGATTMTFTSIGALAAWAVAGYGVKPLGGAASFTGYTPGIESFPAHSNERIVPVPI